MKRKPLWSISVTTTREAGDAMVELLGAVTGQPASSYCDFESGACTATVFAGSRPPKDVRARILAGLERAENCGLKTGPGGVRIEKMAAKNWAESWKQHFRPVEIGSALLIKPSWSRKRPRRNQAMVILDPGLSFGTGQHPTTEFCLRQIAVAADNGRRRQRLKNVAKSFLDIGTGSGILSIAAAKLGYAPVLALDFDGEAVRIACDNARINRVQDRLEIARGDVARLPLRPAQKYDLICANLISDLLVAQRQRIVAQLNRQGTLVLAGILKSEFHLVQTAFEKSGLGLVSSKAEREWRSGAFRFARDQSAP
jgi:ribosomal protein L11 methyltransferase